MDKAFYRMSDKERVTLCMPTDTRIIAWLWVYALLQLKYENGEIDEYYISDEDMDALIEMYKNETEKLNIDTEKRKNHISKMLNELKVS